MHVRTRLSPSLRDIEGNPDIVGASGGPGNKKVSKLQMEIFSLKHIYIVHHPFVVNYSQTQFRKFVVFNERCIGVFSLISLNFSTHIQKSLNEMHCKSFDNFFKKLTYLGSE